jgi:hypothetical protein
MLSIQHLETNDESETVAVVAITNAGSYVLRFGLGTEVKRVGKWQDPPDGRSFAFDSDPILPSTARVVRVAVPHRDPCRVVALCDKFYPATRFGRARFDFDWYVRKRAFIESFYSSEILR